MRWEVGTLVAVLGGLLPAGCFSPRVAACAVQCAADGQCPPDTSCLSDGFCHRAADEALCPGPTDASPAPDPDAMVDVDAAMCPTPGCGNGAIDAVAGETCDDNNCEGGDGCDTQCKLEPTHHCVGQPSQCRAKPRTPGDVIVTEIFENPEGAESPREWFELHNPTLTDWDLIGVTIADDQGESFSISSSMPFPAGAHLVFATTDQAALNDNLPQVDFVYPGAFVLANTSDEISVLPDGSATPLDRVAYTTGFPLASGVSMSLDPGAYSASANDTAINWCEGVGPWDGNVSGQGSPGAVNPSCP